MRLKPNKTQIKEVPYMKNNPQKAKLEGEEGGKNDVEMKVEAPKEE